MDGYHALCVERVEGLQSSVSNAKNDEICRTRALFINSLGLVPIEQTLYENVSGI